MCGHVAIYYKTLQIDSEKRNIIRAANKEIYHRGPDDEGYYENDKISFAFRRLSIIDIESDYI